MLVLRASNKRAKVLRCETQTSVSFKFAPRCQISWGFGRVVQLVERRSTRPKVVGSIPTSSAIHKL